MSDHDPLEGGQMSSAFSCVVFLVQTEFSFVVASLSFCSAHVRVDPTNAVRVTLD